MIPDEDIPALQSKYSDLLPLPEQRMHSPSLQPAKSPLTGPQAIEAKGISEEFLKKSGGPTWT